MSINEPDLPKGWCRTTLASFGELICGQSPESNTVNDSGAGYVYVSGPEQWDGFQIHTCKWTTEPKRIVPEGCIFITVKGAGVGKIFPGIKCAIGRDIYAFKPREGMSSKFVELALLNTVQDIIFHAKGDIPGLSKGHILDHSITLPGSAEQERIASKILELFSDLDKGEESLRQAQAQLKRYRQSVLKAAVTGELTRDWREQNKDRRETGEALLKRILKARREAWEKIELEKMRAKGVKPKDDSWKKKYVEPKGPDTTGLPELPEGWAWASLDILAFIKGGVTVDKKRSPENPVEVPYLRVANVQDCNLDLNKIKTINVLPETIQELRLIPGDILLNEGGDLDKLGRGWVWEGQLPVCIHQNHVFRARLVSDVVSPFFVSYYASAMGKSFFMEKGKQTTNLASISLTKIKSLPVPISGAIENQCIMDRVSLCLQELEAVSKEISIRASISQALRQSILKSAFSGTLVPQDPNDEPASELLKRIAAATAEPASPPPARRAGPRQRKRETPAPAKQAALPTTLPQKLTASGLAQLRKAAGMSQAELAKAIGLNQAYISQMETGKRTITRDQADQIASCLGVPLELLCGKTG